MSLPNRNNPYNFDDFLAVREGYDYYADDEFFQKVVKYYAGEDWELVDKELRALSKKASYKWRKIADAIARPEEQPYIMHYDGHNHRIDRIVRPANTLELEREVFGERIYADGVNPWVKLGKQFIIYQNGEASVSCPLVCTEGLIEIVARYADTPELQTILKHCKDGIDGEVAIGGQYISEIQGGSDIPENILEAVNEDGVWKLYGTKFFCSATHADYVMVTAKPQGSEEVGLFCVPSWLPGNKEKEIRNSYTIDNIKWKIGTSELTTAEITYDGAVAYQVGPLDRGVANVVGVVLTLSRLTVGLSSSGYMHRSVREALQYAQFRDAFGKRISEFGLLQGQLRWMERMSKQSIAGAYKLYDAYLKMEGGLKGGIAKDGSIESKRHNFRIRELVMWQKIVASLDCTDVIRKAMSVFGGHGAIEDFSALPRMYRDSAVNELWEGPCNVLMDQIFRDLQRVKEWYSAEDFVHDCLDEYKDAGKVDTLAKEMKYLLDSGSLIGTDDKTIDVCNRWYDFILDFYHVYQEIALAAVE